MGLTKKYWILIGALLLVIFLGGTLSYFAWIKRESGLARSQPEQIKPKSVKQVIIPSSLESYEVMIQFVPYIPPSGEERISEEDYLEYFEITPNQGFTKGLGVIWHRAAYWIKKDGTKVYGPDDSYGFILDVSVLKYENPEFAREDYDKISTKQEFIETTLEGFKLKTKSGVPPVTRGWIKMGMEPKAEQCQQYLIYSNNFIIYLSGLKEAAADAVTRIIDLYRVE